jgi:hypothetical protein
MPIAYSCPHCGKQYSVAEQYAGQSGPCAACGKPIAIPMVGAAAGQAPVASSAVGGIGCAAVAVALVVLAVPCLGVLVALLLPAVQAAREAARRAQSQNNVRQIVLALHNYHDAFGTLPPAVVTDANGAPLYSGRVLLLPYMEQEALYDQFDLTEPWNSAKNQPLSQTTIPTFVNPSGANQPAGQTDYLFVTGAKTVFEGTRATKFSEITDGTVNTLLVIDMKDSGISWAEPRDLDIWKPLALPRGNHPGGNVVGMADGSVRFMSKNVAPKLLGELSTRNGGEDVGEF